MTEQLIEIDTIEVSPESNPTIWDIENAEKLQFIAFIEEKMEQKYSKKFEYYEQLLLSLQEEHSKQILKLSNELQYTKDKLEETTQNLCYLQDLQEAQITNLLNELEYTKGKLEEQNNIIMNKDFILIGWGGDYNSPIIVPKNVTWSHYEPGGSPHDIGLNGFLRSYGSVGGRFLYIILSQLYKLPNIRNLDLYSDLLQVPNTLLIDKDFKTILKGIGYTSSAKSSKDKYYEFHNESILEIERSYPGLINK